MPENTTKATAASGTRPVPAYGAPKTYTDVGFDQEEATKLAQLGAAYLGKAEYGNRFVPLNAQAKKYGAARTAIGELREHGNGGDGTDGGRFPDADTEQAYKLMDGRYQAIEAEINNLAVVADARELANEFRPWAAMKPQLIKMGIPEERVNVVTNLVNLYDSTPDPQTWRTTATVEDKTAKPLHWQFLLGDGSVVSKDVHNLPDTEKDAAKMTSDILAAFRKYGHGLEDAIDQGARNWPKNTLKNGRGDIRHEPMTLVDPRTNEVVVKVWLDRPTA